MRWNLVDMLRGIAVLLVLFRHHPSGGVLGEVGWLGVDLFFVISGFLVSGLIFDEARATGRFMALRFLIRRAFKIQPSFLALIGITALAMWATDRQDPPLNYIAELLFFQNYHEGLWSHTWSLAVEEHFYLLVVGCTAALLRWRIKLTWRAFFISCVLGMFFFTTLRALTWTAHPFQVLTHFYPSHLRMDSLLAGVLLAGWHRHRPVSFSAFFHTGRSYLLLLAVLLFLPTVLLPFGSFWMYTIGLSTAYVGGMVLVGLAVERSTSMEHGSRDPLSKGLAWIGGISYNTYLWHLFVLLLVEMVTQRFGLQHGWVELAGFVALALLAGWLTTVLVERPALRIRNAVVPSWQRSITRINREGGHGEGDPQ